MAGILPDEVNGGLVFRDIDGNCAIPAGVQQVYCPPPTFDATCEMRALPSDCNARISAAQINAIVSELMALAVAMNPDGSWTCNSLTNLAANFAAYVGANGISDGITIDGNGTDTTPFTVNLSGLVGEICGDLPAKSDLASCLLSSDFGNGLAPGSDGGIFGSRRITQTGSGAPTGATPVGFPYYIDAGITPNNLYWYDPTGPGTWRLIGQPNPPTVDPGFAGLFFGVTPPAGWLKANGSMILIASYPLLAAAIYCGNSNNPTADWGYRADVTGVTRNTAGTHIKLPDARGEFLRGFDDGRGIDSLRNQFLAQAQAIQSHTHTINDPQHSHFCSWSGTSFTELNNGGGNYRLTPTADGSNAAINPLLARNTATGITAAAFGGTETRPRNLAPLVCIKI